MPAMRMVQVSIDEIVDVVAMGNRLVPTTGPVNVVLVMSGALVIRRTSCWIRGADLNHMFDHLAVLLLVMQVAVVKIVNVPIMFDRSMATLLAVLMVMILVGCGHRSPLSH